MDSPKFEIFGLSDIGASRANNEDVWACIEHIPFISIADGMGGHNAGEVAAFETIQQICKIFSHQIKNNQPQCLEHAVHHLVYSIKETNSKVYNLSKTHKDLEGMGTTLCSLCFYEQHAIYAHVGDSRIYHFQKESLSLLTKDHSLSNKLLSLGVLKEGAFDNFPYKNVITKAIGTLESIDPSIDTLKYAPNDIFLMCSDGLSDYISEAQMKELLGQNISLQSMTEKLIEIAKNNKSRDNITVVLVKVS
ncbi:MAG: Stp1/IreP family PP2C-type Ser/Thr phosphatase [Chlamydiae bacterium]|nr:Stp1/IreP family PP2C-type Ser/Thr phosphatase [Chlamydiota bacterium]